MSAVSELRDGIAQDARKLLRDHAEFFEISYAPPLRATVRLPRPLILSLDVYDLATDTVLAPSDTVFDARNGLLRLPDPASHTDGIFVQGFAYEWFLDEDLTFFADMAASEHTTERPLTALSPAELKFVSISTLVYALWSLLTQFSTEIDTFTPEGMSIPAHQRFTQVQQMLQYWKAKYDDAAAMLNIGLKRIDVHTIRRISRTTGRLVPLFENREVDDPRPPLRAFPVIESVAGLQTEDGDGLLTNDIGIVNDGWFSLGTSGN